MAQAVSSNPAMMRMSHAMRDHWLTAATCPSGWGRGIPAKHERFGCERPAEAILLNAHSVYLSRSQMLAAPGGRPYLVYKGADAARSQQSERAECCGSPAHCAL